MNIRIIKRPAVSVVCMRETGLFVESANAAWQRLAAWLESVNVVDEQTDFLGVMHDDPDTVSPDCLRYDACVTVPQGFKAPDEVLLQELAAGEYAVTLHVGPYEKLGESWDAMMEWLVESSREVDERPCFEIYRNDPRSTPQDELETELYLPLKRRH